MDVEERLELVKRPPTEEVVTEDDLRALLEREAHPKHYIGFEISGVLHLGYLISAFKINDFLKAGMRCKVFLADWHSYINNKWGGDWETIKRVAREYYADAFSFISPGVEIEYGSRLYEGNSGYWVDLVRFSKQISLARDTRCLTIMGRTEKEKLDLAQYIYPPMQATDIRAMDLDIVHSGMDQRKVHMLAREVFPSLGWKVPVAVHHHLLAGLEQPKSAGLDEDARRDKEVSSKMSKSNPGTAVFIHDSEESIEKKLARAWCPEKVVEGNPVLDFARYIAFHEPRPLTIERPAKYGGEVSYEDYNALEGDFAAGKLHPSDLKRGVASSLNAIIAPMRAHFQGKKVLEEVIGERE